MYLSITDSIYRFSEEWPGDDGPLPDENLPLLQSWAMDTLTEIGMEPFCTIMETKLPVIDSFADMPADCVRVIDYGMDASIRPDRARSRIYARGHKEVTIRYYSMPLDGAGRLMIPEMAEAAIQKSWMARWAWRLGLDKKTRSSGTVNLYQPLKAEADRLIGWTRGRVQMMTQAQKENLLAYRMSRMPGGIRHTEPYSPPETGLMPTAGNIITLPGPKGDPGPSGLNGTAGPKGDSGIDEVADMNALAVYQQSLPSGVARNVIVRQSENGAVAMYLVTRTSFKVYALTD